MNRITIFTPAYNRAHTLRRLYNSIKEQEHPNFEWIIVDDGSKDNTKELVKEFISEQKVDIKYFYQENSGKHIAINKGVEAASGNLFFMIDSDDFMPNDALNVIEKWEKTLNDGKYIGIAGLRKFTNGEINGTTFDNEEGYFDCGSLERFSNGMTGDKAEVVYTEIFKKYKFPKFEGENFLCEGYVWDKISRDGYLFRWFNEPLIIGEYLEDGLTKKWDEINKRCPKGRLAYMRECIKYEKNFLLKMKQMAWYVGFARGIYTDKEIREQLGINRFKMCLLKIISKLRRILKRDK